MGLFGRRTPTAARAGAEVRPPAAPGAPTDSGASRLWSDSFGRVGTRSVQILAVIAVIAVFGFVGTRLTLVVIPVLIALVLAAAIFPLVSFLRRHGFPSLLATWISLLTLVALLSAIVWLVVRAVVGQWDELRSQALDGFDSLQTYIQNLPFDITDEQIASVRESAVGLLQSDAVGSGAIAGVSQTTDFVAGFFIMIVVVFFFLKDGPAMWEFLLRPFEGHRYERGRRVGAATITTLGGYVRGTAIVGVPLVIPLSVLVFLLAFIPLVGATLAGILAALVALVAVGPVEALIVVAIVVAVNQLEGDFLQPIVMGRTLRLHPLVILFALTAGTVLVGITGAVLAVPIAASIWRAIQVWDGPDLPARFARQRRPETV